MYSEHPLQPVPNPLFDYLPFLRISTLHRKFEPELPTAKYDAHLDRQVKQEAVDSNVIMFLSSYCAWLLKTGQLQPALATASTNAI